MAALPDDNDHPQVSKREYKDRLEPAALRMREVALACHQQGQRGVVVVEGADTAGKGGAIRRLTSELDPRFFHVWPIGPPTPAEKEQHYLQRFWQRLPAAGQIAIFDRSWYGRVLVERVDSLTPKDRWRAAYDEINQFEAMLTDDGIRIAKFYLHVTEAEQQDRLIERAVQPHKWWKISEADIRAHLAYDAYCAAAAEMLEATSTDAVPWQVIAADSKRHARLSMLDTATEIFGEGLDLQPPTMSDALQRMVRDVLGVE